jgi:hypothetical protein
MTADNTPDLAALDGMWSFAVDYLGHPHDAIR